MDERLQCHLCNKEDNEGIIILNKYICRECELEIISPSVDELKYEVIKRSMKDIWKGVFININVNSNGISF
ncbi:sigma factor G inhibitor Gin [Alkaliphilus sp. B6464]|uniref:sigma factor G inhibitor Gin n=1 Tax=Alkaliphilus sp. B6464 TaxID=2731219 RepID=UPI001BA4CEC7|nr:sigma factor G inhibitor Gin [Alkaliphilus sp. B6464]QUH19443.1 sigma factor G inhibitor Gin [Alkaliphilus sp. B6464]